MIYNPAALPSVAPRGKQFTVLHLSHVVGSDVRVVEKLAGAQITDAEALCKRIDYRLNPSIGLTERRS